jgi:hypothetical protein
MNNQEAFTIARDHLLKQGKRSVNGEACLYRASDGSKCAVGCLIPDDQYDGVIENHPVEDIIDHVPALRGLNLTLLDALQSIHDNENPDGWEADLRKAANEFKLIYTEKP